MATESALTRFKVQDRVKRVNATGCLGVVKEIKLDVMATTQEAKERGVMVGVLWDNGTTSYLAPDSLSVAK